MKERYFALTSTPAGSFSDELEEVLDRLASLSADFKIVWARFHLSDIANQYDALTRRLSASGFPAVFSAVGQAPANGGKLALEAWAVSSGEVRLSPDGRCAELKLENYRMLFFRSAPGVDGGSYAETREEFAAAEVLLASHGGTLEGNLQRTWLYCRDIDNNYAGLVRARREFFAARGMTPGTHFIASTGIEGKNFPFSRLVGMDSFALFGHEREQIVYLKALDHLSPTALYNVTFERGTKIVYGDRSHLFISGTASIDREGKILHEGDVAKQACRMVENVAALLDEGGATLKDIRQCVVYLRDFSDRAKVEAVLEKHLPSGIPRITLSGSVCRPGWLVEMDAIAVSERGDARFKPLQ